MAQKDPRNKPVFRPSRLGRQRPSARQNSTELEGPCVSYDTAELHGANFNQFHEINCWYLKKKKRKNLTGILSPATSFTVDRKDTVRG